MVGVTVGRTGCDGGSSRPNVMAGLGQAGALALDDRPVTRAGRRARTPARVLQDGGRVPGSSAACSRSTSSCAALCRAVPNPGHGDRARACAEPALRARFGGPAAARTARHRLLTGRRSRRPPTAAAVPVCPPTRGGQFSPTSPRVRPRPATLALAGPACRALESGHPGMSPLGSQRGRGGGHETGFGPPRFRAHVLSRVLIGGPHMAVVRLEVTRREPVLGSAAFKAAGGAGSAYEKVEGVLHLTADPAAKANEAIADLGLAPRNARGLVEYSADFYLLRPLDAAPPPAAARRAEPRAQDRAGHVQQHAALQRPDVARGLRQRLPDAPRLHGGLGGLAAGRATPRRHDGDDGAACGRGVRAGALRVPPEHPRGRAAPGRSLPHPAPGGPAGRPGGGARGARAR